MMPDRRLRSIAMLSLVLIVGAASAESLTATAREEGCTGAPVWVQGTGLYRCPTRGGVHYFNDPSGFAKAAAANEARARANAAAEQRFRAAFAKVKVGMTIDQVERIDQLGDRCTDWSHQRPPACGPLRYYGDKRTVESVSGVEKTYTWGRKQIVFKNGMVILIVR